MKKAKEGATRRLRIASFLCLLFMIFEFVGKKFLFVLLIFCFDTAQQKNVVTQIRHINLLPISFTAMNITAINILFFFFFVVACNEEYIMIL